MIGQFIFPTLKTLGLNTQAVLRNTSRQMSSSSNIAINDDIKVHFKCYAQGQLAFESQSLLKIPFASKLILDESNCPALKNDGVDYLIQVKCTQKDDTPQYFPQEHQLIYTDTKTGIWTSLLYDQLPFLPPGATSAPIVLIAPKIWISEQINTFVIFSNSKDSEGKNSTQSNIHLDVMSLDGKILHSATHLEKQNDNWIFDVKNALKNKIKAVHQPEHLTVVARGGASNYVITTLIKNERAGTYALEHSLSPHYYFNGDRTRVRKEALDFTGVFK